MEKGKRFVDGYIKTLPHWLIIIVIFILGLAVYSQSFIKGVFLYDDKALVINNPFIKNFSFIKEIFTTQLFSGSGEYSNAYRPMQSLSFMLDYCLWGLNPFGYHLATVLIHILNAVAVYFLIYIISKNQYVASVTGALFCVHTVLSILVNYVAGRADLLLTFFFLGSIISYVLYKEIERNEYRKILYLCSLVCFILAILSKELAIILPFVLLLYLKCFPHDIKRSKKPAPSLIWVFFIIMVIYVLLRSTVLDFTSVKLSETTVAKFPLYNRLLTSSKIFMIYLRLLFFPVGLHMEWDIRPATSFLQDEVFLSITALFIIAIFVYFLYRTSRLKFFAISWFFITLVPHANIFPLTYFMSESWLYIPSIGFFALIAIYLYELKKRSTVWAVIVNCAVILALISYCFLTFNRAHVWADPVKMFTEILKYSPNNTKIRIHLGTLLYELGLDEEAMERYKEATELIGEDSGIKSNIGAVYAKKEKYDAALKEFEEAVKLDPNDYMARMNIGIIYKKKGDFKSAEENYKKAISINPDYCLVYNNLGNLYLERGMNDEAIKYYKKAIDINPYTPVFYENLGKAYRAKGLSEKAKDSFRRALELDPNNRETADYLKKSN